MPLFKHVNRRNFPSANHSLKSTLQQHLLQTLKTGRHLQNAQQRAVLTHLQSMLNPCSKDVAQQQTTDTINLDVLQSHPGVIPAYFTKGLFGQMADESDVKIASEHVNASTPDLSKLFSELNNSNKSELTFVKWIQINLKVNPGGLPLVVETETIDAPNSSGAIFSLSPPFFSFSPDLLMNWQLDARGGSGSICTP